MCKKLSDAKAQTGYSSKVIIKVAYEGATLEDIEQKRVDRITVLSVVKRKRL